VADRVQILTALFGSASEGFGRTINIVSFGDLSSGVIGFSGE
jgi:hypothetical protein